MNNFSTMPLRFRVWDKEKDDWVEAYAGVKKFSGWCLAEIISSYKFDYYIEDLIISQDTGFVDKNGKHIFTGDIVDYDGDGGWIGVVVFEDGVCFLKNGDGCQAMLKGAPSQVVVGNIFENPELLEDK